MAIFGNYIYEDEILSLQAKDIYELEKLFLDIKNALARYKNSYFLGYIKYESLANLIYETKQEHFKKEDLAFFTLYKTRKKLVLKPTLKSFGGNLKGFLSKKAFKQKIQKIKSLIANGDIYQLNFTQEIKINSKASSEDIFYNLLSFQNTSFKALFKSYTLDIISFSPELFFKIKDNRIYVAPMKGTIKRGSNKKEDEENIHFLQNDPKNMSENVMIADLLRNDLSKIATNIKVDKLFSVQTHKSLHQMTTQISADLSTNSLFNIFKAIFPSGSITGAPKKMAMQEIDNIESYKRGIYCGAFGLIEEKNVEFCIPIRTIVRNKKSNILSYGVGSGIVWQSDYKDEYEEVLLKAKFLQENTNNMLLIETILLKDNQIYLLDEHIKRLKKSAKYFGFSFKEKDLLELISYLNIKKLDYTSLNKLEDFYFYKDIKNSFKLRISLHKSGFLLMQKSNLEGILNTKIKLSKKAINNKNDFLYHKTSFKDHYKELLHKDVFDSIFYNENLELTEGNISNIILQINNKLYTPPTSCGLLGGTLREVLLKKGLISQKKLYLKDIQKASKIFCINSLRGIVQVQF